MEKRYFGIVFVLVFVLAVSVFAAAQSSVSEDVSRVLGEVNPTLAAEVQNYVQNFVSKRGVSADQIKGIDKIDFNSLPKEVNIENVDDTNVAIYEVDYGTNGDQLYVITYSVDELKAQGDLIIAHDKRQFLAFGYDGTMLNSGFLDTSLGVKSGAEKGYVMMREGSITAISTNLEVSKNNDGQVDIVIYKNGEAINFGSSLDTSDSGAQKDYDVQSKGVVTFEPGDVISAYARGVGDIEWKDVITMVEITTVN